MSASGGQPPPGLQRREGGSYVWLVSPPSPHFLPHSSSARPLPSRALCVRFYIQESVLAACVLGSRLPALFVVQKKGPGFIRVGRLLYVWLVVVI